MLLLVGVVVGVVRQGLGQEAHPQQRGPQPLARRRVHADRQAGRQTVCEVVNGSLFQMLQLHPRTISSVMHSSTGYAEVLFMTCKQFIGFIGHKKGHKMEKVLLVNTQSTRAFGATEYINTVGLLVLLHKVNYLLRIFSASCSLFSPDAPRCAEPEPLRRRTRR